MKRSNISVAGALAIGAACFATVPAHASLIDHGITYTLFQETTADPLVHQFTLSISGINGATDDEGGRYGVESFAFNKTAGFVSATAPSGFTYTNGGLNASGCSGSGNFFCFYTSSLPAAPPLTADSTLSYVFTVKSASFAGYNPDFKINWLGTQNNYDLVSQNLAPTDGPPPPPRVVPEPATLSMLGLGLAGLGFLRRRRKVA